MKNVYQPQDLQKIQAAIAIADAGTMMDADPQLLYGQMHVHPAWIKIQNTRLAENFLYKAAEKLSIQQDTMNFGNLSDAILQKINSELMSQIMLPGEEIEGISEKSENIRSVCLKRIVQGLLLLDDQVFFGMNTTDHASVSRYTNGNVIMPEMISTGNAEPYCPKEQDPATKGKGNGRHLCGACGLGNHAFEEDNHTNGKGGCAETATTLAAMETGITGDALNGGELMVTHSPCKYCVEIQNAFERELIHVFTQGGKFEGTMINARFSDKYHDYIEKERFFHLQSILKNVFQGNVNIYEKKKQRVSSK